MNPNCWYIAEPISSSRGTIGRFIKRWSTHSSNGNGYFTQFITPDGRTWNTWEKWVRPTTQEEVDRALEARESDR